MPAAPRPAQGPGRTANAVPRTRARDRAMARERPEPLPRRPRARASSAENLPRNDSDPPTLLEPAGRSIAVRAPQWPGKGAAMRSDQAGPQPPPLMAADLARALVRPGGLWREIQVAASTGSTNTDLLRAAA